ncbi:hypothetical protein OG589_35500 [Sphaerisporangium sp. NBC_01403]|uniref:hypothetical protein n=1 Tax=Sphaerisporangium sp. NBC_01403 TaxID=2903599 RepID=UPI0032455623
MQPQAGYESGDVAALVIAGLFTVTCLGLAWMEHRDSRQDKRSEDRDLPES